jgi:hypothetical protein
MRNSVDKDDDYKLLKESRGTIIDRPSWRDDPADF